MTQAAHGVAGAAADAPLFFKRRTTNDKTLPVLIIRPLFHFADGRGRVASAADGLFWVAQAHQVTRSIWSADDTDDGRIKLHTEGAMRKSLGGESGQWTHMEINTLIYQSKEFEGTSFAVKWEGTTSPYTAMGKL